MCSARADSINSQETAGLQCSIFNPVVTLKKLRRFPCGGVRITTGADSCGNPHDTFKVMAVSLSLSVFKIENFPIRKLPDDSIDIDAIAMAQAWAGAFLCNVSQWNEERQSLLLTPSSPSSGAKKSTTGRRSKPTKASQDKVATA
eukprot:GHVT01018752.1.p4 GENE.GHVT01018752.1~~GHVT01018752.1.p4  ORF type:complete len:145 (+),score=11.78 GHVT01018752.1:4841-5275(+)